MTPWYDTWETIDRRVTKLKAFEAVTLSGAARLLQPDYSIRDQQIIVDRSVQHIQAYINRVEAAFPGFDHVVLVGGKDSQLILLAPKLNPDRWHMFSAEPNYTLNVRWVERNGVRVNRVFSHDNRNEESLDDLVEKIICGDLYSDPSHIRWLPTMRKIADGLEHRCLFWGGTMSSPGHFYDGQHYGHVGADRDAFFRSHFHRTAAWQGNYHQAFKNFVGRPYLSPFHSFEIWQDLFRHIDPAAIPPTDLRRPIGESLFGRPVWWIEENPAPGKYDYAWKVDGYRLYVEHLRRQCDRPLSA
jgi:hypothetical protein